MIERYTRSQMKAIWDLKHKYEIWLEVELQATAAFERAGQAPRGTAAKLRKKAKIDVARIAEIEKVTKHANPVRCSKFRWPTPKGITIPTP